MESEIRNILLIDDDDEYMQALLIRLKKLFPDAQIEDYNPVLKGYPADDFNWGKYDVLILDYYLGVEETGLDWFCRYKTSEQFPATIILTGMDEKETAVHALKSGVHHYLSKTSLTKGELFTGVEKALAVRARRQLLSSAGSK